MTDASISPGLAFVAGLASFLSACVLPLVPGVVVLVAGLTLDGLHSGDSAREARRGAAFHAALFVVGFAAVFVALGASGTAVGGWMRGARPLVHQAGGVLVAAFGAYLLVLPRLPVRTGKARGPSRAAMAGAAGAAFGAGWTPCIGPVLASALLLASMDSTLMRGLLLLCAFALGLGVPFWLAAVAVNAYVAGAGRRALPWASRVAGTALVVIGAMMATGRFAALTAFLARFAPPIQVG